MTTREILSDIERRDPDGYPQQPTPGDYRAHREWAIAAYGVQAWKDYLQGCPEDPFNDF